MAKKINYGKILIVILLTILIWIWADLALDETLEDQPAVVLVDESASSGLWVNFNGKSSANIRITLSGPHTAISKEEERIKEGYVPHFDFDASKERMQTPGEYQLELLSFLQKNKDLAKQGIKVVSCDPNTLSVEISKLVEKPLTVKCFDEDGNPVTSSVEPKIIKMLVPNVLDPVARVTLTAREIKTAMSRPIRKEPFIQMPSGETRQAHQTVQITTPPEEQQLNPYQVTAVLGITTSTNLVGHVNVEILNRDDVLGPIPIRATQAAYNEYKNNVRFKVTLEILDDDKRNEPQTRQLTYNFPESYVESQQIELVGTPVEAKFIITEINP